MSKNRYKIVEDDFIIHKGRKLYRIKALKRFNTILGTIKRGELGGYVEGYHNLSQNDNCWIHDDAKVYDNARVENSARVGSNAEIYGNARIRDRAVVDDNAEVFGNTEVSNRSVVTNHAKVYGNARVIDEFDPFGCLHPKNSTILDNVSICGNSVINSSTLADNAKVFGNAKVNQVTAARENIKVYDNAVAGECKSSSFFFINDNSELYGNSSIILRDVGAKFSGDTKIRGNSSIYYFSKSIKLPKVVEKDVDCKDNFRNHEEKKV